MFLLAAALARPPMVYEIPFPTSPVFEGQQRICMDVDVDLGVPNVAVEEGPFLASCSSVGGHTRLCVTLLDGAKWPDRFADLECPGAERSVKMRPIRAFDPNDSIDDGVLLVRSVSKIQAVFRAPDLVDSPGILPGGTCFVRAGLFTVAVGDTETRVQTCTLIVGEVDLPVRIKLVGKLPK